MWATRKSIHVNRTATAWLIRRFLDPAAEIRFVEPGQVADLQRSEGAIGFDAPGAVHPHRDAEGRCSFERLVDEHFGRDPALVALARIVHAADFFYSSAVEGAGAPEGPAEAYGLWAISQGFTEVGKDDDEIVARASFLYDSLLAHLQKRNAHG